MFKRRFLLLLVLGGLLTVSVVMAQEEGTVVANLGGDYDFLDPHRTNNSIGYQMSITFYDRLTALDDDGNVIPSLAESWEGSGVDQLTLHIRDDVICTDGTALTPEMVAASLLRMGANDTGSPYMYRSLGGVAGDTERLYSVEFDNDAGTVTMIMHEPFGGLLIGLSMPWTSVVCPAGLEDPDTMISTPQGTGPYALEEALRGDSYTVVARPEYVWGPRGVTTSTPGFPQKIIYRVVENDTTAANMLLTNELDITGIQGADLERVEAEEGLFQVSTLNFGSYWLQMNQDPGLIGTDPVIREAVYRAVSRDDWRQVNWLGRGELASSFIGPQITCWDPSLETTLQEVMGYDPDRAKALLIEHGYEEGDDGLLYKDGEPLTIRFAEMQTSGPGAEYIIAELQDIGISVDASIVDFQSLIEILFTTGEWDLSILPYGPPVPLPYAAMAFVDGTTATNTGSFNNQVFHDEAMAALGSTGDERCGHWVNAQTALLTNYDYKPLVTTVSDFFGRGVEFTMFNGYLGTWDPITTRITRD